MSNIEILALILVVLAIVKILMMLYNPESWFNLVQKIYVVPQIITLLALVSSLAVLYFLINSGLTIVEILAVALFIALLMMMALASYAEELIIWLKQQDMQKLMRRTWLYLVIWVLLLAWGAKEILLD